MKPLFVIISSLFLISADCQESIVISEVINDNSISVYKEASCINKIGEIPGHDFVFVLDKIQNMSFLVYRNGIKGYVSRSWIKVWQKDYDKLGGDIESKIISAKKKEIQILNEQNEKFKSDSIKHRKDSIRVSDDEKRELATNKRLGVKISHLNYIDGRFYCGFSFDIINYANNKIKYFSLSVSAYNPVNDFVSSKTFRYVGPINPYKIGSYKSDLSFTQNAIDHFKITKLDIEYFDGSTRHYSQDQIKLIEVDF